MKGREADIFEYGSRASESSIRYLDTDTKVLTYTNKNFGSLEKRGAHASFTMLNEFSAHILEALLIVEWISRSRLEDARCRS